MSQGSSDSLQRLPLIVGACFGLVSFSVSIIVGLQASNPAMTILLRGLFALLVCYSIGYVLGHLARFVLASSNDVEPANKEQLTEIETVLENEDRVENVAQDTPGVASEALQSDQDSQAETKDVSIQAV